MIYGYARVSTSDQKIDLQILALQEAGCESIFVETATGADRHRPELTTCLAKLQSGDVLVVWKLDRLGRSLSHLVAILDDLSSRGVQFRAITQGIETGTSTGRLVSHILGALAEFERELIKERTREGIKAAKGRRQKMGRRTKSNSTTVLELAF